MKKYLLILLIALPLHAATIYPLQETFLQKVWRCNIHPSCYRSFGSTVTTINGSDTLTSSRSVINTNFANLNTDKIQSGNTVASLTITTGTIGTLSLTNALAVPNGGTGSTTLSSNQILLGNGTGIIKVPAGYGTTGQFLTSNGIGSAPTWTTSAVDQAGNYTWTGTHIFTNFSANVLASSTQYITNVGALNATSSITLAGDPIKNYNKILYLNTTVGGTTANSTTTLASYTLPANTFGTGKLLRITMPIEIIVTNSTTICQYSVDYGNGLATSTIGYGNLTTSIAGAHTLDFGEIGVSMVATTSASQMATSRSMSYNDDQGTTVKGGLGSFGNINTAYSIIGGHTASVNTANQSYIAFNANDVNSGSATCQIGAAMIEILQP